MRRRQDDRKTSVCSCRIDYCNSLLIGLPKTRLSPLQTVLNAAARVARLIARLPRYSHMSSYIKDHLHCLPISTRIVKAEMGWHRNISLTPSDFRPLPHPFVLCAPWTGGSSLSLGLGQPWPCPDPFPSFPLLALVFGIAYHLQLVLLSYHQIFLRPYHFLTLVSFLGANRTKSASVCPWLLRGAI